MTGGHDDEQDEQEPQSKDCERSRTTINKSERALLARGFSSELAAKLVNNGSTLASLQRQNDPALSALGITPDQIRRLRENGRTVIPSASLAQVLWDNRYTCCVCRSPERAIIVHHIRPWADSRDHSAENLAVLCTEDHARAHRTGTIEQNLTSDKLREAKRLWEERVRNLDARAILEASRSPGHHWWWFNHVRLFEIADVLGVSYRQLKHYDAVLAQGLIVEAGYPSDINDTSAYRYAGGNGILLYQYTRAVLEDALTRAAIYNVSDDLDPGLLSNVLSVGDLIFVNGKHYFKKLNDSDRGPGQSSEVRRQANNVRISFMVDRWEATSNSAWSSWISRSPRVASILRIGEIDREGAKLHLRCTGIALGSNLSDLSTRFYAVPTWPKDGDADLEEDDFLQDFG